MSSEDLKGKQKVLIHERHNGITQRFKIDSFEVETSNSPYKNPPISFT